MSKKRDRYIGYISKDGWVTIAHAVATADSIRPSEALKFMDDYGMKKGTEIEIRIRPSRGEVDKLLAKIEKSQPKPDKGE